MAIIKQSDKQLSEYLQNIDRFVDGYQIENEAKQAIFALQHLTFAHLIPPSQGSLSAKLSLDLAGNAVVDLYQLKITAARADQAVAAEVAQLRAEPGDAANTLQVVVDFGTVRTVSAALITVSGRISKVEAWNGTEFPLRPAVPPFESARTLPDSAQPDLRVARFRSDVRTERLRITIVSTATQAALLGDLRLILPDTPKDLTITINGGSPVWNLPGPAVKGGTAQLSTDAWNNANQRLVDLTQALQDLTGDPLASGMKTFDFTLTSREAGYLSIEQHALSHAMVRRASFNGASRTQSRFAEEGTTVLPLAAPGTPAGAKARALRMKASGEFPADRRIPAVGPPPGLLSDGSAPLSTMTLTPENAVILRLLPVVGVPRVAGLRLPLAAGADGAELRLVPWQNAGPGRIQPEAPLQDFSGEPVTLSATSDPVWTSAFFAEPMEIDPDNPPWVALVLARGAVTVALSQGAGASMRVGPGSGPWRDLPALFSVPPFSGLRMPYHAMGEAEDPQFTTPLIIEVPGSGQPAQKLNPIAGGTEIAMAFDAVPAPALQITHFAPGTLEIDEVDIVFDI